MVTNRSTRAPVQKRRSLRVVHRRRDRLRSQPIARVAALSADGQPDVVPLAFEFDGTFFWVGGSGPSVADTRKFRNVRAGNHKVALVIDDMVSFDPFIARRPRT
jgi:pyridoxamine 5'-phosphate oxidase family protein